MDYGFRRSSKINLLITLGFLCLVMSSVLTNGEPAANAGQANTTTETEAYGALPCLPDSALNALLVQMLMAIQPYFLSYQYQQQRMQSSNNNELFALTSEPIRTTVVTSSIVSTLTQTLSKVISIWYRNERIPTTLYSQTTVVMTDLITITSTLQGHVEPTEWKRERRGLEDATLLDSSLSEEIGFGYHKTRPLPVAESIGFHALPDHLIQPRVLEAWNNFLHVLEETQNEAREGK
ncbi:hypothetical protein GHT06_018032 [Daphnia sinensis]|uniref:Uncharacterized protein n=1 Tax=Daphnia sinensis TaxID=1820382 RepID=A0AAD5KN50_9CRUS|nr:hypothetical protein GHT06_018032 [Daphnia sinensis]